MIARFLLLELCYFCCFFPGGRLLSPAGLARHGESYPGWLQGYLCKCRSSVYLVPLGLNENTMSRCEFSGFGWDPFSTCFFRPFVGPVQSGNERTKSCSKLVLKAGDFVCLVGFLTSSSTIRLYPGRAPRQSVWQFYVLPHMRQSSETMTSVSAGHIILKPT